VDYGKKSPDSPIFIPWVLYLNRAELAYLMNTVLCISSLKHIVMPSKKTDTRGFSTENPDMQEDIGAKGGPAIGLGDADASHGIPHPYNEDLQTQIAAKGKKKQPLAKPAPEPVK
jgi:hypothetical protein